MKIPKKINYQPRWFECEFPMREADICFYRFFNSILSCQIWPCRDSHGIFDLAIFEMGFSILRFFLLGLSLPATIYQLPTGVLFYVPAYRSWIFFVV